MSTPILQFGTSRFLQAHADLFIDEAIAKGEALGPITVVQTTGAPERAGRVTALAAAEGYPVRLRGRADGVDIDREQRVKSVRRALSTSADWEAVEGVGFVGHDLLLISESSRLLYFPSTFYAGSASEPAPEPTEPTHDSFSWQVLAALTSAAAVPLGTKAIDHVNEKIDAAIRRLQLLREGLGPDIDIGVDFHAAEVVDGTQLIVGKIPKSLFLRR